MEWWLHNFPAHTLIKCHNHLTKSVDGTFLLENFANAVMRNSPYCVSIPLCPRFHAIRGSYPYETKQGQEFLALIPCINHP